MIVWWGLLGATRWRGLLLAVSKRVGYCWNVVAVEHDCEALCVGSWAASIEGATCPEPVVKSELSGVGDCLAVSRDATFVSREMRQWQATSLILSVRELGRQ